MKEARLAEQVMKVEMWNQQFPVGTRVRKFERPNDWTAPYLETTTLSEAALQGGDTAVVSVEGIPGCVPLDCLLVVIKEAA